MNTVMIKPKISIRIIDKYSMPHERLVEERNANMDRNWGKVVR